MEGLFSVSKDIKLSHELAHPFQSDDDHLWRLHIEYTDNGGCHWLFSAPVNIKHQTKIPELVSITQLDINAFLYCCPPVTYHTISLEIHFDFYLVFSLLDIL